MSIDWFTFVAQIINFLILVGLLRWFLYGPIMRAMQQREDKIGARWSEAEERTAEAERKADLYDQKNVALEQQREKMMKAARDEANEQKSRLMKTARDEVEKKRAEWMRGISRERNEILGEIQQQVGQLAVEATRKTLHELATVELEETMVRRFVQRFNELDDNQRVEIETHLSDGDSDFHVQSAFALSDTSREEIRSAIEQAFDGGGEVIFDEATELICGLQLDIAGYGFGWNVQDIVHKIDAKFGERLIKQHA